MPLRDHFHGETAIELPWPTMAQAWLVSLMRWLKRRLKEDDYRAYPEVFVESGVRYELNAGDLCGPRLTIPAVFPDRVEVIVHQPNASAHPVGVVTLVMPRVKAEPARRAAFVRCCVAHLHHGTGLVLIDVVADGSPSLHNAILDEIAPPGTERLDAAQTCVVTYGPNRGLERGSNVIQVWTHPAPIGQPLPTVPFLLADRKVVFLDLEGTYTAAIEAAGV
jgi:hypothetical protein